MRIGRILPAGTEACYDAALLTEPAEVELRTAVEAVPDGTADASIPALLDRTADVVAAADRFFTDILVNAEEPAVRASRQGLLASVLSLAPAGIDWRALDIALG